MASISDSGSWALFQLLRSILSFSTGFVESELDIAVLEPFYQRLDAVKVLLSTYWHNWFPDLIIHRFCLNLNKVCTQIPRAYLIVRILCDILATTAVVVLDRAIICISAVVDGLSISSVSDPAAAVDPVVAAVKSHLLQLSIGIGDPLYHLLWMMAYLFLQLVVAVHLKPICKLLIGSTCSFP